jgi:hypothetical protein
MRFSLADKLQLPCVFERLIPGQLHADGRRYLPLILLHLIDAPPDTLTHLAVVDRHHLVRADQEGQTGVAQLLFLQSRVTISQEPYSGLFDLPQSHNRASTMPDAYGTLLAIGAWEVERKHLPYESLYAELLIDLGFGTIGVRTSDTAPNLAEKIGKERLEAGDRVRIERSRIDILGFQ